jgi:hypothetical protein
VSHQNSDGKGSGKKRGVIQYPHSPTANHSTKATRGGGTAINNYGNAKSIGDSLRLPNNNGYRMTISNFYTQGGAGGLSQGIVEEGRNVESAIMMTSGTNGFQGNDSIDPYTPGQNDKLNNNLF